MSNEANEADAAKAAAEERARIERRRAYVSRVMSPAAYGIAPGPLETPEKVGDALTRLRSGGVNIIGPEIHLDHIPRNHIVSLRLTFFDQRSPPMTSPYAGAKASNGVWYEQNGGGLSMHYATLNQLASLCGMTWIDFQRTDDGGTPLYWRFAGRASCKFFDGTIREVTGVGESDLRDGSAEIASVKDKQLVGMRAKGSQRAESIAKARIIRELFGLRQKYSIEEADMPFVFPALVFHAPADPEIDRLMALRELGLLGSVYGGRREVIDIEPRMLPAPGPEPVDYAAENAAENARLANRERVPVGEPVAPPVAAPAPQRAPAVTDPDAPPFEAPPAPAKWRGTDYTLAEVADYCEAQNWPDPTKEAEPNLAKLEAWIRGQKGGADIRAFLGRK